LRERGREREWVNNTPPQAWPTFVITLCATYRTVCCPIPNLLKMSFSTLCSPDPLKSARIWMSLIDELQISSSSLPALFFLYFLNV
jgi:hypothetical protein